MASYEGDLSMDNGEDSIEELKKDIEDLKFSIKGLEHDLDSVLKRFDDLKGLQRSMEDFARLYALRHGLSVAEVFHV